MKKPTVTEQWVDGDAEIHVKLGDEVFVWYDHANIDYPEDLCWSRMIADVFWAGFRMGNSNYKTLLKKYIRHVGECEGIDFIDNFYHMNKNFTDEEWNELVRLSKEVISED